MKKLYVISALVLWGFTQIICAQNMYRNYFSPTNVPRPTSAISVVHSNGDVYFFQADGNGKISISEIDPLSMNPTGNDVIYDITGQNFGFNVNGGFEDDNGNFVLFGNTNNSNPALVVITSNLSACSAYYWGISWSFFAGCSGYDTVGDEVYLFVNNGEILAQADPYSLSSGIHIAQLGATFLGGSCPNYQPPYNAVTYHNDLEMFNLALNQYNPCNSVLIAGVEKWSVLTETYDISLSSCDKSMWHNDFQANAKPFLYPLNPLPQLISPSFLSVSIFSDSIAVNKVCDEANACSHQFGGKSLQQSVSGNTPTAEIRIEPDKLFVCEGFEGDIHYSLYDMAGKLLQQGITRNGKQNRLKKSNGIYLLRAIDSTGNQLIKKVVVL